MKKVILSLFLVLVMASPVAAAWTLTPTVVSTAGSWVEWKVLCTSDGAALSATDLVALMPTGMPAKVIGQTLMFLKVSPGTGGVAPNNTINITLGDTEGATIWSATGVSYTADSWQIITSVIGGYFPVMGKMYLSLNDIGDSGDQVTLYFYSWKE